jgi:phospholipid transport system substrate-binding protein
MKAGKIIFFATMIFVAATHGAHGAQPLDALSGPIGQFVDILKAPQYADAGAKDQQRGKMWEVARNIFDFEAIARGTLTRYRWKRMTPEQRDAFTAAFTEFIGNNYFNQIQGGYQNEEVVFLGQKMLSQTKARVMTRIVREAIEISVEYSMWRRKDNWRIFNVYVEGVSLLGNYRNEFERFLSKTTPDDLIAELKKKSQELNK